MRPGEGTSPLHVLATGHKERFVVFEERKAGDIDVLKCAELIGDLLGGADRTCRNSTVCSNMADC